MGQASFPPAFWPTSLYGYMECSFPLKIIRQWSLNVTLLHLIKTNLGYNLKNNDQCNTHQQNKKSHIISTCRKWIWQNSTPFHDKHTQQQNGTSQSHKGHYEKLTNIILNSQGWLLLSNRKKTRISLFDVSIQHCMGGSSQGKLSKKRKQKHPDRKGRSKMIAICRWYYLRKSWGIH